MFALRHFSYVAHPQQEIWFQSIAMLLQLTPNTTVRQINKVIWFHFPHLKLEVYSNSNRQKVRLQENDTCKMAGKKFKPGVIEIEPSDTVASIERKFQQSHGLLVQVLLRSGSEWIKAQKTDGTHLQQLEGMGAVSSRPVKFNLNTLFL